MKIKSLFKDIILVLLICLNLFLVVQIWFDTRILSVDTLNESSGFEEYLIKPIRNLFTKENGGTFSKNIKNLMRPQRIILNQSNKRAVLYANNEDYQEILNAADEMLANLFLGKSKVTSRETVTLDDYCAVLKRNSVYLDYDNLCDFRIFSASVCGDSKNQLSNDFSIIRECIFSFGDNVLNNVSIYMKDYKSANIYKYTLDVDKQFIENKLSRYFQTHSSESTLNYSFELNFHKKETGDSALTKLVFDPLIMFNLVESETKTVAANTTWQYRWAEIEDNQAGEILSGFRINPMTMRKYTNMTNARVFVENDATLTLSPDGILEYKTVEGGQGLMISTNTDKSNFDIYTAVSAAVDFVYLINEELPGGGAVSLLRFNSDLTETSVQGSYTIAFDLYVNGLPMLITDSATGQKEHCITMKIENGYLKHYKQYIRQYELESRTEKITPVINAVDDLIDILKLEKDYFNIINVGRCYVESRTDGKIEPQWNIRIEGVDDILTVK